MFTTPAIHRDDYVDPLEALDPPELRIRAAPDAVLRQRRVQVDDVRHHGRAEDPRGEEQRIGPVEAGDNQMVRHLRGVGLRERDLEGEGDDDDPDEPGDDRFEPPEAGALEGEDHERPGPGEKPRREERDAEEEVEPERRSEHLGQVRRHGDQLRLDPHAH